LFYRKSFSSVDDVSVIIEKMKKSVNLKLNFRPNETLARLYDGKRGKLLLAFPPKIYRLFSTIKISGTMVPTKFWSFFKSVWQTCKV